MRALLAIPAITSVLALAAGADAVSVSPSAPAQTPCPATKGSPSSSRVVGEVTDVLHSRVYVDRKFVGTPPLKITAGARLCTDDRGQAVLDLSLSGKKTICIMLPSSTLQAAPLRPRIVLSFEHGTTWCSIRPSDGAVGTWLKARATAGTTPTILGISIDVRRQVTVKVWSGSATVVGLDETLRAKRQATVDAEGKVGKPRSLRFTAEERIAIARLRVA